MGRSRVSAVMSEAATKKDKLTRKRRAALSAAERLDIAAVESLRPVLRQGWARRLGALGNLADEPPLLALGAATALAGAVRRDHSLGRAGLRMLLAQGVAIALKEFGKNRIDRSRPDALLEKKRYRMRRGRSRSAELRSFPSGHTAGAFAVAGALAREYPRHRTAAYLAAGAFGALQVLRRAHFPGDVAAGLVLGLGAKSAGNAAAELLFRRSKRAVGGAPDTA
jgi:membrane-associated phospholipid phosphatase